MTVRRRTSMTLALAITATLFGALVPAALTSADADVTTVAKDTLRTGWYPDQPGLTPSLVGGGSFGQQFSTAVVGQVYAQPLVANGTLVVATEANWVYGLDPADGSVRWSHNLGGAWNPADVGCADLTPSVGITGTPVFDPATNAVYLVSKQYASGTSGPAIIRADGYDVTDGHEVVGFPLTISGHADNDPTATFDPTTANQRPGLLLLGGVVYAAFGSHCDAGPFRGWVAGFTTSGVRTALWASEANAGTNPGGGVWQSGGGLVSDGAGQILLTTGNGAVPATATASTASGQFAESVVRLGVQPDGTLAATDFFTPYDAAALNAVDGDLGSGAPVGLPDSFAAPGHPHLMAVVGKAGYLYLLDRDHLGGFAQSSGGDAVVSRVGPDGGVWGKPAVWPGDGGYLYVATASQSTMYAGAGALHAYQYAIENNQPVLNLVGTTPAGDTWGIGASSPVVTSSGTTSGSAVVWVVAMANGSGVGAELRAYAPVPVGGVLQLIKAWPIGTGSKFLSPTVDADHVYVGTRDGHVLGFGSPATSPFTGGGTTFAPTTVNATSATQAVTLTAVRSLSVTDVAISPTSTPFTIGTTSPSWSSSNPVALQAGDTFTVPVSYTPMTVGPVGSTLTVTTDSGTYSVPIDGFGKYDTAYPTVSAKILSFGGLAVGQTATAGFSVTNAGGTPLTLMHVAAPSAPFSVVSGTLPADGTVLQPGESWPTVSVQFSPTALGTSVGNIVVQTDSTIQDAHVTAGAVTVAVSGTGATLPQMTLSRASADLGAVPVGQVARASFLVTNSGGTPLTITLSKPPIATGSGFTVVDDIAEGTTIPPGQSVTGSVQLSSTVLGRHSDVWRINSNDPRHALQTVTFAATVVPATTLSNPLTDRAGWKLASPDAAIANGGIDLTPVDRNFQSGAITATTPLRSSYLHVSFDLTTGGGGPIGANGTALMLLDATHPELAGAKGDAGAGLGWAGLGGTAVGFLNFDPATNLGTNAVGIASATTGSPGNRIPDWSSYRTDGLPPLRDAITPTTRHVDVTVSDGVLRLSLDGTEVLSSPVQLAAHVLVGFAAADGMYSDLHRVTSVRIVGVAKDVTPPPVPTVSLAKVTMATSWLAVYSSKDTGLGTASYDVLSARALPTVAPGRYTTLAAVTSGTKVGGPTVRGYRYCVRVRARDAVGNVSAYSAATCTTVPMYWSSLARSGRWRATFDPRVYSRSYVRPLVVGSTLSYRGGVGSSVVLVVDRIPRGGTITVRVGAGKIFTVSLAATRLTNNVVVVIPTGAIGKRTIVVRATRLGSGIRVDGLGVTP